MARRSTPAPRLDPDIARLASALADRSRVAMLDVLLDGGVHTIGALARRAGISAATASAHLRRLVDEQLVSVTHHGRERRVELAGATAAQLLESLATFIIAAPAGDAAAPGTASNGASDRAAAATTSRRAATAADRARTADDFAITDAARSRARELRFARTCYDHLAGVVGVRVTAALLDRRWLRARDDAFIAAPDLLAWLADHGRPVADDPRIRRPLTRACLDWSERTPHLAGRIGAAIADLALASQWVVRVRGTRALRLTTRGRTAFATELAATFG